MTRTPIKSYTTTEKLRVKKLIFMFLVEAFQAHSRFSLTVFTVMLRL